MTLWENFICNDVLFAKDSIDVLDELHCNNLVCQLIVIFVKKFAKLKIENKRMSVLRFDKITVFQIDINYSAQRFLQIEAKSFERLTLFALRFLTVCWSILLFLMQDSVDLWNSNSEILLLIFFTFYLEDLCG